MKLSKFILVPALLVSSTLALAATYYGLAQLKITWAQDSSSDGYTAAGAFRAQYIGSAIAGSIHAGDFIDIQYSDGTIVQFTLVANWKTAGIPWDPDHLPQVIQGAYPKFGKAPTVIKATEGNALGVSMSPNPGPTTPVYSVTVTCTGCNDGSGGASGGGGGADAPPAGGDDPGLPEPCQDVDCGKDDN